MPVFSFEVGESSMHVFVLCQRYPVSATDLRMNAIEIPHTHQFAP